MRSSKDAELSVSNKQSWPEADRLLWSDPGQEADTCGGVDDDSTDAQPDEVATSKLAVDREVEQRQISKPALSL